MLTPRQHQVHSFVCAQIETNGIAPSIEEIRRHFGFGSKSNVHAILTSLEQRGYLRRLPNRARAVEVLRLPDGRASRSVHTALDSLVAAADAVAFHGADPGLLRTALERHRAAQLINR